MEFNKKRYRKLLKYSRKLEQEKKRLFDISESDYDQLLGYFAKKSRRLELESLDFYLNLIKQSLEGKICAGGLFLEYLKLQKW